MKKRISLLFAFLALSLPSLASAEYRIAYSSDGNQHDPDDWHASAMTLAMIAETGNKWRLAHFDYNNHLGDNDWQMAQKHRQIINGAIQRYGYPAGRFFDDQNNLWGAVNNLANAINASHAGDRLYLICAGPMEVCYRGIDAAWDHKEQYVTVISHSWWNENHNDTWQLNRRWSDIQRDFDVQAMQIGNQNDTAFRSKYWDWTWLKNENHGDWLYKAVAEDRSRGDASDAGMTYYVLKGLASSAQYASMNDIKALFASGSGSWSGGDGGGDGSGSDGSGGDGSGSDGSGSDGDGSGGDGSGGDNGGNADGVTPPGGNVALKIRNSGKCVDLQHWSGANGGNVQQWACHGYANQKWRFESAWDGLYIIRSQHSNKCAEVAGKSWSWGANVDQWYCHKGKHQQFDLVPRGDGWFNLKAGHSGKCLAVDNAATWNGANLVQQNCHGGWNQQFRFDWSN